MTFDSAWKTLQPRIYTMTTSLKKERTCKKRQTTNNCQEQQRTENEAYFKRDIYERYEIPTVSLQIVANESRFQNKLNNFKSTSRTRTKRRKDHKILIAGRGAADSRAPRWDLRRRRNMRLARDHGTFSRRENSKNSFSRRKIFCMRFSVCICMYMYVYMFHQ